VSCFMVSDSTINVIVSNLHLNRDLDWLKREFSEAIAGSTGDFCVDLGAALFALNILAVEARYGKGEAAKFRPLDYRFRLEPASARRVYDESRPSTISAPRATCHRRRCSNFWFNSRPRSPTTSSSKPRRRAGSPRSGHEKKGGRSWDGSTDGSRARN